MAVIDRRLIREVLHRLLRTSADFDAFVIDYFPDVYRRFSDGMDRTSRENLLLLHHEPAALLKALRNSDYGGEQLASILSELHADSEAPPPTSSAASEPPPAALRLMVLNADEDSRSAERLGKHLAVLQRILGVQIWRADTLLPGDDTRAETLRRVAAADVVVMLLSADFLFSPLLDEFSQLALRRRSQGLCQIIPVLARPVDLAGTPFAGLTALPRNGQSIAQWRDQDEAWTEVVRAIRTALDYRPSPSNALPPQSGPLTPQERLDIAEIFPQSGLPKYTYVEPDKSDELLSQLRNYARILVVEGPSGIGKTTAVYRALRVVGVENPEAQWFRATSLEDLERLDGLLKASPKGHIVIDDFHYLDATWQKRLAFAMQSAATALSPKIKFTAIGVAQVYRTLTDYVPNLQQRTEPFPMGRQSFAKLDTLLVRGARLANIEFQQRAAILNACMGSFSILQDLCYRIARKANIERTELTRTLIPYGPTDVEADLLISLDTVFHKSLRAFVHIDRGGPLPRGTGLVLLWLLGNARSGEISTETARDRYPQLAASFGWLLPNQLREMMQKEPFSELFTCKDGSTLTLCDPRLALYLSLLKWPKLIFDTGMSGWSIDASGMLTYSGPTENASVAASPGGAGRGPMPESSPPPQQMFPASLVEALQEGKLIPFVGAGVSRAVREAATGNPMFPTWTELMELIAQRLDEQLHPRTAAVLRAVAQDGNAQLLVQASSEAQRRLGGEWGKLLERIFRRKKADALPPSLDLARAVWQLGSNLVITTNYDQTLRWTRPGNSDDDFSCWSVTAPYELQRMLRDKVDHPTVWHLHGSIEKIDQIILSASGYHRLYGSENQEQEYKAALATLRTLLMTRTFLFIGFSFTDSWFSEQVAWVKELFGDVVERHYLLVRARDLALVEERLVRGAGLPLDLIPFDDYGAPQIATLRQLASRALASSQNR